MATSQSPDEDSLSSDQINILNRLVDELCSLNPLTRIHCLPTLGGVISSQARQEKRSQSPDEDSLSSDRGQPHLRLTPPKKEVSIP